MQLSRRGFLSTGAAMGALWVMGGAGVLGALGGCAAATPRTSLRDAAAAVLTAWEDATNRDTDMIGALDGPMARLRAALAVKPARMPREPGAPRKPREGTKQEQVLAMLRRPEGATVAQIA